MADNDEAGDEKPVSLEMTACQVYNLQTLLSHITVDLHTENPEYAAVAQEILQVVNNEMHSENIQDQLEEELNDAMEQQESKLQELGGFEGLETSSRGVQ